MRSFLRAAPGHGFAVVAAVAILLGGITGGGRTVSAAPATRPTTRPIELPADVEAAARRENAADLSLIPTILLWLGSEQDGLGVGLGTPRLRLCCHAARRLQIKQAVPWLITLYSNPTADPVIRDMAAESAIRLDPYYAFDFLHAVLDDDSLPPISASGRFGAARRAAAGALASAGDEDARTLLLDAYRDYLDRLAPDRPLSGLKVANYEISYELSRIADPVMVERVRALRASHDRPPARLMVDSMIDQLLANLQPVDELVRIVRSEAPEDVRRHPAALIALGHLGDAATLPLLREVRRSAEERMEHAASQPASAPATSPAATQPHFVRAIDRDTVLACNNSINEIELRSPVPVDVAPIDPAATQPVVVPGQETVPDTAELVRPLYAPRRSVGGVREQFFMLSDPGLVLSPFQVLVRSPEIFDATRGMSYGTLARVQLEDGGHELRAMRPVLIAPGENTPNGYVFAGTRRLKEGAWEHAAVVLRKLGRETVARIPNRRHSDGTLRPDAALEAVANSLAPGASVEAVMEPGGGPALLSFLAAYRPPIAARLLRFTTLPIDGQNRPAAELLVAFKHRTMALPPEDASAPTLDPPTLSQLSPGTELKVVEDEASGGARLASVRLDAAFAARADLSVIAVRAGRATYVARQDRDYAGSQTLAGSRDVEISHLRAAITRATADRKSFPELPDETIAALRRDEQGLISAGFGADEGAVLQSLVQRWVGAGPSDRAALELEAELRLARISANISSREQQFREHAKALLTPGQYRNLLASERSRRMPSLPTSTPAGNNPAPTTRSAIGPATQPATAP